jgi:hypothetical protein
VVVGVPPLLPIMGPDKRARRSDFWEAGNGVVGDAGMEIPTTDDVGRPLAGLGRVWELEEVDEVAAGRRRDAHDFLSGGGAGAGTGMGAFDCDERAGEGGVALSSAVGCSDGSLLCPLLLPAREIDVLVESGDSGIGVSGAVEQLVSEEEGMEDIDESSGSGVVAGGGFGGVTDVCVRSDGNAIGVCMDLNDCDGGEVTAGLGKGGGDGGGVVVDSAFWTIDGGGRARGENMSPGALAGSLGGRDHITQPPRSDEVVCFGDGGVDVDSATSLGWGCGEGGGGGEEGGGGGN